MDNLHANKFSHKLRVNQADIDILGHVNNVVYLRWVQEVAIAHWEAVAPTDMQKKYRWVVLRHEIDYHLPAFNKQEIIGYTWVGENYGARFDRFVHLYLAGTSQLLAAAKTTWCLLDAQNLRPKRIDADILAIL